MPLPPCVTNFFIGLVFGAFFCFVFFFALAVEPAPIVDDRRLALFAFCGTCQLAARKRQARAYASPDRTSYRKNGGCRLSGARHNCRALIASMDRNLSLFVRVDSCGRGARESVFMRASTAAAAAASTTKATTAIDQPPSRVANVVVVVVKAATAATVTTTTSALVTAHIDSAIHANEHERTRSSAR